MTSFTCKRTERSHFNVIYYLPVGMYGRIASGYIADRHGLEPYASRSGYDSVKDAFTAEKHIFHARHSLYVHITGGIHGCKVSGVDDDLLTRLKIVFHYVSVEFGKYNALTADLLHDEAFTAEETGSDLLTEMHGECNAASLARNDFFWKIISLPGVIWNARIDPGKQDANAIMPLPFVAV